MRRLRPFFSFFGGKRRSAPRYPHPRFGKIKEPFAGSAGYSTLHASADVFLTDEDPIIVGVWAYLIRTSSEEIRRIPLLAHDQSVEDLGSVPQEARHLVGFWLNKGTAAPCRQPGAWMRAGSHTNSFWGEVIRERIAYQVNYIRHWQVKCSTYVGVPNERATWFVDPPYQKAGEHYRFSSKRINYEHLSAWCREREGAVIVCENEGADWLPFRIHAVAKATHGAARAGVSKEVVWTRDCARFADLFNDTPCGG